MSASLITSSRGLISLAKRAPAAKPVRGIATCVLPTPSCLRVSAAAPSCVFNIVRGRDVVTRASSSTPAATPIIKIDNMSDSFATIVSCEFGDNLGEMLSMITALKNIGFNIRRAKLAPGTKVNKFYITESATSEKVIKSRRLEEVRQTVLNSLMETSPESYSGGSLTGTPSSSQMKSLGMRSLIPTTVDVSEAPEGSCSLLKVVTSDRAGLLVDIVRVLKDINLNVVSAEVDTIGPQAVDLFFVTYHGEPLSDSMITLTTNALQYHLSLSEIEEDSY